MESFVEYLERKGYYVIVLRDTETIYRDNLFEKNIIFPHASYDLYLRSAIYKSLTQTILLIVVHQLYVG